MTVTVESLRHFDRPGKRVLDLRPLGVPFVSTLSLSHLKSASSGPATLHIHRDCFEIVYCVRGVFRFETPERDYPFLPDTVFVSRDHEPHRLSSNPKGHFVYRLLVSSRPKDFVGLTPGEARHLVGILRQLPRSFSAAGQPIRPAFERLFSCYDRKDLSAERRSFELRTGVYELLRCVLAAAEANRDVVADTAVVQLAKRMESHPERTCDFAALCGKLPRHVFTRRFTLAVGLPPRAYLVSCRVRRARELLQRGFSVTDVSLRLGFCTPQHFATVFKRETGQTPTEWIARPNKTKGET